MFIIFLNQMIVLFVIMLLGAIAYKTGSLDDNSTQKISRLILNFTNPAMILSSVLVGEKIGSMKDVGFVAVLVISCYAVAILLGFILPNVLKVNKDDKILYNAMTVFSNYGYMGIPIVGAVFGVNYIFYGSIFVFFNNLMVYTYGIYIFSMAANKNVDNFNLKKMFINPGVIASLISLLIFLMDIEFPTFVGKTVSMVGDMTGPLSMMVIGVSLAKTKFLDIVSSKRLWVFSVIRLVLVPVLLSFIYREFVMDKNIFAILIVMLSMPVGSISIIYANEYGVDSKLISSGLLLTTILSVITVPLVIFVTGI